MAGSVERNKMPKSILKNSAKEQEDAVAARNREIAIQHAIRIQHQKDMEMVILESIEALIEYPLKTTDPTNPDPSDAKEVKEHLSSFRPSDLDSAIEERNIDNKCGYMLCPRPRIKQTTVAKFRAAHRHGSGGLGADMDKWCSADCAKRTLYLRLQLTESPPWERSVNGSSGLQLFGESQFEHPPDEMDHVTRDLQQLAIERGETMNSSRAKSLNTDLQERFENMELDDIVPPSLADQSSGLQIEGYSAGMSRSRNRDPLDMDMIKDNEDILDSI